MLCLEYREVTKLEFSEIREMPEKLKNGQKNQGKIMKFYNIFIFSGKLKFLALKEFNIHTSHLCSFGILQT